MGRREHSSKFVIRCVFMREKCSGLLSSRYMAALKILGSESGSWDMWSVVWITALLHGAFTLLSLRKRAIHLQG